MPFHPQTLAEKLAAIEERHGPPARYVVGFSGGVDSVALLGAIGELDVVRDIVALHVDHGLHPDSADWARRAEDFAVARGALYVGLSANVDTAGGRGPEAAARDARYAVFGRFLETGDWLLSAHHRDDQAETLLLNLLRGSGPLGLAGMPDVRRLGRGLLVRPLLDVDRADLTAWAESRGFVWSDDPSNRDTRFDRNFLRRRVVPVLAERWPSVSASLAQSAALAADAQQLLDELAAQDLELARTSANDRLSVPALKRLSRPRQRNLLRLACRDLGLPSPPAGRLESVFDDLLPARDDAAPLVAWHGTELRRYRDELFLMPPLPEVGLPAELLAPGRPAELGSGLGRLELAAVAGPGIRRELAAAGLSIAFRQGGERLRPAPAAPTARLKTMMQAAGVLPWMRGRIPLLLAGSRLVAAGDLWSDADSLEPGGFRVLWHDRPALY